MCPIVSFEAVDPAKEKQTNGFSIIANCSDTNRYTSLGTLSNEISRQTTSAMPSPSISIWLRWHRSVRANIAARRKLTNNSLNGSITHRRIVWRLSNAAKPNYINCGYPLCVWRLDFHFVCATPLSPCRSAETP